ncbi:MAG TPA: PEP-CTERM sorting domain-containing protein [Vicinamibacterales bacterium]|jgi:hypothetical protein|nr:PEP-CTERM sorting domain-containing protein [Vicinamibacterales bacterium]
MRLRLVLAFSAAITAFAVVAAQAAPVLTIFNNRAAWEAAVGSFSEEDFTGFAGTSYQAAPVDVGDFSVSMSGSDFGAEWHNVGPVSSNNDVNGSAQINAATGDAGGLTLTFDFPITAFGANWQGISDARTTSVNVDGTIVAIPNLNGGFWGFTSDTPFTSAFFFLSAGPADGFGIDNVVYSQADVVPEPATLSLLGLGLLGAGMRLRRKAR